MYAVVRASGKQFFVREGDELLVDSLPEGTTDKTLTWTDVLFVAKDGQYTVGRPMVSGAKVTVRVLAQERGPKLVVFKMRRRKNSRRKNGHRQDLTRLLVEKIQL